LIEGDATRDFARNEWGLLPGRVGVALELRTVRTRTHKLTVDLNFQGYVASRPQDMLPDQTPVGTA